MAYRKVLILDTCYMSRYQETFQLISSQLIDVANFMKDVQNWKYLVMAPKRRNYGAKKGKKEDKVWDLFKDGGTEELQNSAAQIISKLLLGNEYNDNGMYYNACTYVITSVYVCMCVCEVDQAS